MWDPVLLLAQIISLQSLHYLTLSLVLPPLLLTLSSSRALSYTHGGSATVGMVMDWRDLAGRSTLERNPSILESTRHHISDWMSSPNSEGLWPFMGHGELDAHPEFGSHHGDRPPPPGGPHHGGDDNDGHGGQRLVGGWSDSLAYMQDKGWHARRNAPSEESLPKRSPLSSPSLRDRSALVRRADGDDDTKTFRLANPAPMRDPLRPWVIAIGWAIASTIDIWAIYILVRRPTMVLDFTLTLIFSHILLTTYYASAFPTSLFFWLVMGGSALAMIIFAEQLCVRREMREGLRTISASGSGSGSGSGARGDSALDSPGMKLGTPTPTSASGRRLSGITPGQEELFNARLGDMVDDGDYDPLDDDELNEQIELLERGDAAVGPHAGSGPSASTSKAVGGVER
ncbi:hypothetical protein DL93DRAFT_2087628 [Clavulina sp. PMI_390]|nr:hypothetical protein DL93DRAFT_2087628 [Clavulina sp. PMI_390]